jgi:polyisoprenoid-binding protein YceI
MKSRQSACKFLLAVLFVACATSAFAQGTTWTVDPVHTQATFQVKHLSMSNVRGALSNITGSVVWDPKDITKDSVVATLDAKTINTGSDYRDKYLKGEDFFNTDKYPTLAFRSTSVKKAGAGFKVTGDLTLAGVMRSVVLDVEGPAIPQRGQQGGLVSALSATTTIKRADFNFGTKYPNTMVSDEIKITIDLEMGQK